MLVLSFILALSAQGNLVKAKYFDDINGENETSTVTPTAIPEGQESSSVSTIVGIAFYLLFFGGAVVFFMLNRRRPEDGMQSLMGASVMSDVQGKQVSGQGLL